MSAGPLVFEIFIAFVLAATTLFRYGDWYRHHIFVTIAVLVAWYFSFLIIFIIPLDVSSTVYRQCLEDSYLNSNKSSKILCKEPWSKVNDEVLPDLWRVVYWSSQFLTWIIMPMMQSYIKAGDFTIKGKLKAALIDNAIYYGSVLGISFVLVIYIALQPGINLDWQKLKAIASSSSNTWGLFLLVLLLGYALVEVPRNLWNKGRHSHMLSRHYFKVAKLSSEKSEAEDTVDDVLESLKVVTISVQPGHPLRHNLEIILQKIPVELQERMNRRQLPHDTPIDTPNEKVLVRLHAQTIKALNTLQRTETQWNVLIEKIFDLEDTIRNSSSRDHRFKRTFDKSRSQVLRTIFTPTIEWYWRCVLYAYTQRMLAVFAGILSFAVVWSELTFFNKKPVLSFFAMMVNAAKASYDYFTIEVFSTIVIAYLCYCAYSTVLKIKFLNIFYLAPHHQTNEYSLIFSGMMLSRLTPPLCLNFLSLIHMDSHIIKKQVLETYYTQIMGHMDVISIISNGFNIYFPMMIIALCLATYFSIGSRILSAIGFHQFMGDDELTTDLVDEGREIIKREKRKRQRAEESLSRRREFQERFQNNRAQQTPADPIRHYDEDSVRSNLLKGDEPSERYSGLGDVDTRLPSAINNLDDIDARFGNSTRPALDRDAASFAPDRGRTGPPRRIFDDV